MAVAETSAVRSGKRGWRSFTFRAVAVMGALLYLAIGGLYGLLVPWFPGLASGNPTIQYPEIHYWHDAEFGALFGILLVGSLLALAWRPHERPLLIQFVALLGTIGALAIAPFSLAGLIFLLPIGLVVVAYPDKRRLFEIPGREQFSRPMLALTGVAAALMARPVWNTFQLQLNDSSEHATANHWIIATTLSLMLVAAGLLAAGRRMGWIPLGIITGVAFIFLGLAALTLPEQAGSWGVNGGVVALLGGVVYIVATLREARQPASLPVAQRAAN
jgi:hypothetical protein